MVLLSTSDNKQGPTRNERRKSEVNINTMDLVRRIDELIGKGLMVLKAVREEILYAAEFGH